jgi:hypothetical protein
MNQVIGTMTMAIGIFFCAAPQRAAKIWGQRNRDSVVRGGIYYHLYRITGILLCLGGFLLGIENIWPPR